MSGRRAAVGLEVNSNDTTSSGKKVDIGAEHLN
jgi:hypothetical protein